MGYIFVFEFMLGDLTEVIRNVSQPLTTAQIKSYMRMLLNGVSFCHENRIMHRVRNMSQREIASDSALIGFETCESTDQHNTPFENSGFWFGENIRQNAATAAV